MKKKVVFVLVYNEWDGGGGDISENVIASLSKETIEAHKKDLDDKSAKLQNKLGELEEEKNNKLKPIWEELHPIIQELRQSNAIKLEAKYRSGLVAKREELMNLSGTINEECYKKKDDLVSNFGGEYYIDDPDTASFIIEELEVI